MAPKFEKAKAIEKEHIVVDGVDVSGHWNRMFEQRVITQAASHSRIVINAPSVLPSVLWMWSATTVRVNCIAMPKRVST